MGDGQRLVGLCQQLFDRFVPRFDQVGAVCYMEEGVPFPMKWVLSPSEFARFCHPEQDTERGFPDKLAILQPLTR